MKLNKLFKLAIVLSVISVFTGCSDEINAPSMSPPIAYSGSEFEQQEISTSVFRTNISLKPGQSYSFDYSNTGFYTVNFIMVTTCDNVEIKGYNDDELIFLSCYSSGFTAKTIRIKNISSEIIEPVVYLKGSDKKNINPDPRIIESEG